MYVLNGYWNALLYDTKHADYFTQESNTMTRNSMVNGNKLSHKFYFIKKHVCYEQSRDLS